MVKTVVVVNDFADITGGADKVAIDSAIALSEVVPRVILFTASKHLRPSLRDSRVEVICLDQKDILRNNNRVEALLQGLWNFKSKKELESLLQTLSNRDTIIHIHSWTKILSPSIFSITAKYNFKVVYTLHDYFLFCPNGGLYNYCQKKICSYTPLSLKCMLTDCDSRSYAHKVWRVIRQFLFRYTLKKNKRINLITISSLNNKIANTYGNNSHIVTRVNNPIQMADGSLENRTQGEKSRQYYCFIGRMSKEKGIDIFCKACSELNIPALVIGSGEDLDYYKDKYPDIVFAGWKTGGEIKELIPQIKALIYPSYWYEASPLTTKELAFYGIPCIVSDACAAAEDVIDGVNGFLFTSANLESLKSKIIKLEESNWIKISNNVKNYFDKEKYSMPKHIENLHQLYNNILSS